MAKKPTTVSRKQTLKVFRTPIGFHDAYVAVPSRKAALEAWGADSNIFAQGIAEQVTDPTLMEEPLAHPGRVIKRVRGSADEHFAELAKSAAPSPRSRSARVALSRGGERGKRPPKPSRGELDAAEAALEQAEKAQRTALKDVDDKIRELEGKRRDLQRRYEVQRGERSEKRDRAKASYERALREWQR